MRLGDHDQLAVPDGEPVLIIDMEDGEHGVLAPGAEIALGRPAGRAVDVCIVFDTTGSMSTKIDGLIRSMVGFVEEMAGLSLDWRLTVVPFGDLNVPGDRIDADLPFVSDLARATAMLQEMPRFGGGGNDGESSIEAVTAALGKAYRQRCVKVLVLLTDEPANGSHRSRFVDEALGRAEAICLVASVDQPYFREWAGRHGGAWYPIEQQMDTTLQFNLLRSLVSRVASVAADVHSLAGGSVANYLRLGPG